MVHLDGMLPIRKISPSKVALTSYYDKMFIIRSDKKINDNEYWLTNQLQLSILSNDSLFKEVKYGDTFDNYRKLPKIYDCLSMVYRSFIYKEIKFNFDFENRKELFSKEEIKRFEVSGSVLLGKSLDNKTLYLMDDKSFIYEITGGSRTYIGFVETLFGLDLSKAKIEIAELSRFGKNIPMIVVFGYRFGLTKVLETLKINYRRSESGKRLDLQADEYVVKFANENLIFNRKDYYTNLFVGGLLNFRSTLSEFNVYDFDFPEIYLNLIESIGLNNKFLIEIDNIFDLFIDHITEELLIEMKEPTEMDLLLRRAVELLTTNDHPDEMDMRYMRIKGNERFAGHIYKSLIGAMKRHSSKPITSKSQLDVNPQAVWIDIQDDSAIMIVEESNPIKNVKEKCNVTFSGTGGRSSRSLVKSTRRFGDNDLGIISESTTDNADTGATVFLSANPKLKTMRGIVEVSDPKDLTASNAFSATMLNAPCSDSDDSKRISFIGIQADHIVATKGWRTTPLRTGYESVIGFKVDENYASMALENGRVLDVKKDYIKVEYESGSVKVFKLGRKFGVVKGDMVPHDLVTNLIKGQEFKAGSCIVYNTNFFEPDYMEPGSVTMKTGALIKTAIMENPNTHEDGSCISARAASLLSTNFIKEEVVTLKFDQSIRNLMKAGELTDIDSILCTIEDPVTSDVRLFGEEDLETLSNLMHQTPRAGTKGKIDKVEIIYNGDIEDMSESLREVVMSYDKERKRLKTILGDEHIVAETGKVTENLRIDKTTLTVNMVAISFFISYEEDCGIGD